MEESVTIDYAGRPLTIGTGGLAKQADGSVLVQYGETVVLVTVVSDKKESDRDFLPLTVNYQEMFSKRFYPFSKECDLNLRRAGILFVDPESFNNRFFLSTA